MDVMYRIMEYLSLGELRLVIACGGILKATAVAVLDQDRESRRWRDEVEASLPGFAERFGDELPPGCFRSLVEALTLDHSEGCDSGWEPEWLIEKKSEWSPEDIEDATDPDSIDPWLRDGVLIAVVRVTDLRSPDSSYRPATLLFAAAWNMRDLNSYRWVDEPPYYDVPEAQVRMDPPSIYHHRVADAATMRYVNDLVTLDVSVGGGVCHVMTYVFGLHPPSGALDMISNWTMEPQPLDVDIPVLPRSFAPPDHLEITHILRSRSIPFDLDDAVLPLLHLSLGIKNVTTFDDGRDDRVVFLHPDELKTPTYDDPADYAFEASWVFNKASLAKLETRAYESLVGDAFNPLEPFAQYLASLMPLTVAYESWSDNQYRQDQERLLATGSLLATVVERVAQANGEPERPPNYPTEFRNVYKSPTPPDIVHQPSCRHFDALIQWRSNDDTRDLPFNPDSGDAT